MTQSMPMSTPKRILHIPRRYVAHEWGGVETVVLELSRQQQRQGWEPSIVTSMALASGRSETIGGVPVTRFPYFYPYLGLRAASRAALDKKGGNLLSLSLLRHLITTPGVRLFHSHALKRLGGQVRTAARWRRLPYVVTLHGGYFDVPEAEMEELTRPAGRTWEWGKAIGAMLGSRRLLDDADMVLCIGASEFAKARERIPHGRVALLPNGVNSARFAAGDGPRFRALHGIPPEALLVMNISRIDGQKNQAQLVRAFGRLRASHPGSRLVLAGPVTQPGYAEGLRSLVGELGLSGAVSILPAIGHEDPALADAYHACDVFVLPSLHEPFGVVVLEAWCCRKPVVVSSVGGLRDLVQEGRNGFLYDPGAEGADEALAGKIRSLADNPELRDAMGRAGRGDVADRFEWSRIGELTEALYQQAEAHAAVRYSLPPPASRPR